MQDHATPMEIYIQNPNLRDGMEKSNIIGKYKDGDLYIPGFDVEYEKDKKNITKKCFPFYHNMLLELIINLKGDWKTAMQLFKSRDNSYITNGGTTIILKGKFI